MRCDTFPRAIAFAALAAGGVLPWLVLARPILGAETALHAYLVGAAAAYLAGLARERGRAAVVFVVAAAVGIAAGLATRTATELALALGVLVAVGRSAFLYRSSPARAAAIETLLIGGGLVFARLLCGRSAAPLVLALWTFFLVQSLYFLMGGIRRRARSGRERDAFQDAYGRAVALLERGVP